MFNNSAQKTKHSSLHGGRQRAHCYFVRSCGGELHDAAPSQEAGGGDKATKIMRNLLLTQAHCRYFHHRNIPRMLLWGHS